MLNGVQLTPRIPTGKPCLDRRGLFWVAAGVVGRLGWPPQPRICMWLRRQEPGGELVPGLVPSPPRRERETGRHGPRQTPKQTPKQTQRPKAYLLGLPQECYQRRRSGRPTQPLARRPLRRRVQSLRPGLRLWVKPQARRASEKSCF